MLQLAIFLLTVTLADTLFGFTGVAAAAAEISAVLFYIFSLLLTVSLITALRQESRHRIERR